MDLTILAPILWPLPNLVSVIRNNKSTENKAEVWNRFELPLRSKKAGRFGKVLGFARSHSI